MKNKEIAGKLYEIADLLEMQNVQWKPQAYRKAARTVENLNEDIEQIAEKGKKALMEIPGIGEAISEKIMEYFQTGKIKHLEELKKETKFDAEELMRVPGLGPKRIRELHEKLKIKNVQELKKAAELGKIGKLPGFGEQSEKEILKGIELVEKGMERMPLGFALSIIDEIKKELEKEKNVEKIEVCGSVRRWNETIGDIDVLVQSRNANAIMKVFTEMKNVKHVLAHGESKSAVVLANGMQVDLRVVGEKSWGSALQYFTGSKEHSVVLRTIAIKKGLKLNEYGIFKNGSKDQKSGKGEPAGKQIAGETEEGVYRALGLEYIEPELRENLGEIEAAQKGKLPKLLEFNEILSDLHCHSNWSDGRNTIKEMLMEGKKLGLKYMALTDHVGNLAIANALDVERIRKRNQEIEKASEEIGIPVLKGCEANITLDGKLDLGKGVEGELEFVIASVHGNFKEDKEKQTRRLLNVMDDEKVNVIGHLTGRVLGKREGIQLDFEKVFEKAKERNIALELNCRPDRSDIDYRMAKKAIEIGCKISIGTDSHSVNDLQFRELGWHTARKAWATRKDIINCMEFKEMQKFISK